MSRFPAVLAAFLTATAPAFAQAQTETDARSQLSLELNATQDVDGACRLSFVARNETGVGIEKAVFETVIFDAQGGVVSLSLFDFRDLPKDRPRVRQFDLPGMGCNMIGQTLINGASTCVVDGAESDLCDRTLSLTSRVSVELLG
ncbi:MAG: hypothetical protein AAGK37_19735 [Pseudomonadota bacterium]